ncbi:MAG TPA: hypothetical protein VGL22_04775 [Terracidiphilus sp.]
MRQHLLWPGFTPRFALLSAFLIAGSLACRAQAGEKQPVDQATLQALVDRVTQLEARVHQLEAAHTPETAVCSPAAAPAVQSHSIASAVPPLAPASSGLNHHSQPEPQQEAEQPQAEPTVMDEQMDVSKTLLRIRGFGDVSLQGDTQKNSATAFTLGQLDLFVTSDVSEKFRFLSEIVFEGSQDNIYGKPTGSVNDFAVDVERYLLQYSLNNYFRLSLGRGHTAIGYYNNAYHHSTWMQTTADRPYLFEFEDSGGILPVHIVGASASGSLPSGQLGLHYVAEIGNGRESRNPFVNDPVENVIADQDHKAFNLAVFARPESLHGFQTGVSVYRDVLVPTGAPKIGETIVAAHAVLIRPKYEFLTEAVLDRHAPHGSSTVFHTPGFYTQFSRQYGQYRPYFRYEYLNAPRNEPVFPDVGLRHGPLAGVRFDANESVALKFQYNYNMLRDQPSVHTFTGQVGFTF